jgi:hypothetical protein
VRSRNLGLADDLSLGNIHLKPGRSAKLWIQDPNNRELQRLEFLRLLRVLATRHRRVGAAVRLLGRYDPAPMCAWSDDLQLHQVLDRVACRSPHAGEASLRGAIVDAQAAMRRRTYFEGRSRQLHPRLVHRRAGRRRPPLPCLSGVVGVGRGCQRPSGHHSKWVGIEVWTPRGGFCWHSAASS